MRLIVKYLFFFNLLIVSVDYCNAQQIDSTNLSPVSTFNLFREPSYISVLGGVGNIEPLMFEGDIVPYYMLSLHRNARWGIELSPRIMIRMYNKESFPVRTPSYMPRATFFYQIIDNKNTKRDWFTYFSWYHHSNGQDGYFYNSDSVTINTSNGSFSTNHIESGFFFSRPDFKRPIINFHKFSVGYCYDLDKELKTSYGRVRFAYEYQASLNISDVLRSIWIPSYHPRNNAYLMQSIRLGFIAGKMDNTRTFSSKRFIFRYTVSLRPSFLNDVIIFAQYYHGQDYYNIFFNRTLRVLRVGIAAKSLGFN